MRQRSAIRAAQGVLPFETSAAALLRSPPARRQSRREEEVARTMDYRPRLAYTRSSACSHRAARGSAGSKVGTVSATICANEGPLNGFLNRWRSPVSCARGRAYARDLRNIATRLDRAARGADPSGARSDFRREGSRASENIAMGRVSNDLRRSGEVRPGNPSADTNGTQISERQLDRRDDRQREASAYEANLTSRRDAPHDPAHDRPSAHLTEA